MPGFQHISVKKGKSARPPAITQACQQLRNETLLMFYANNIFTLSILCGDETSHVESLEGADQVFRASLEMCIEWLKATSTERHAVVPGIELIINHHLRSFKVDMRQRKQDWHRLVAQLMVHGYRGARVKGFVTNGSGAHTATLSIPSNGGLDNRGVQENRTGRGLRCTWWLWMVWLVVSGVRRAQENGVYS